MTRRIAIIQGNPDPKGGHFGHALAHSYVQGAADGGHEVRTIDVARLEFPLLHTKGDWENALFPEAQGGRVAEAADELRAASWWHVRGEFVAWRDPLVGAVSDQRFLFVLATVKHELNSLVSLRRSECTTDLGLRFHAGTDGFRCQSRIRSVLVGKSM